MIKKTILYIVIAYLVICALCYWMNSSNWQDKDVISAQEKFARFIFPFKS